MSRKVVTPKGIRYLPDKPKEFVRFRLLNLTPDYIKNPAPFARSFESTGGIRRPPRHPNFRFKCNDCQFESTESPEHICGIQTCDGRKRRPINRSSYRRRVEASCSSTRRALTTRST